SSARCRRPAASPSTSPGSSASRSSGSCGTSGATSTRRPGGCWCRPSPGSPSAKPPGAGSAVAVLRLVADTSDSLESNRRDRTGVHIDAPYDVVVRVRHVEPGSGQGQAGGFPEPGGCKVAVLVAGLATGPRRDLAWVGVEALELVVVRVGEVDERRAALRGRLYA